MTTAPLKPPEKINMFYLRDILVKNGDFLGNNANSHQAASHASTQALQEKLEALTKIKQNSSLVVFYQAMHSFLVGGDFLRLSESIV